MWTRFLVTFERNRKSRAPGATNQSRKQSTLSAVRGANLFATVALRHAMKFSAPVGRCRCNVMDDEFRRLTIELYLGLLEESGHSVEFVQKLKETLLDELLGVPSGCQAASTIAPGETDEVSGLTNATRSFLN
jgi:hypothetical protein